MNVLSVNYDLHKEPSRVYAQLEKALTAFAGWCRPTESSWLIKTVGGPEQMYQYLKPYLHARDKITITKVDLKGGWWSQGLSPEVLKWLHAAFKKTATPA